MIGYTVSAVLFVIRRVFSGTSWLSESLPYVINCRVNEPGAAGLGIEGLPAVRPVGHQGVSRPGAGDDQGSSGENRSPENNRLLYKKIGFEKKCFHKEGRSLTRRIDETL